MIIRFGCDSCGQHLEADQGVVGQAVHCTNCGKQLTVPEESTLAQQTETPTGSDISFDCDHCGQNIVIEEAGAGLVVQCPKCGHSLGVPRVTAERTPHAPAESSPTNPANDTKQCPFCAEEIRADALKCKHCGEFLDGSHTRGTPPSSEPTPRSKASKIGWLVGILAVVGLIVVVAVAIVHSKTDPSAELEAVIESFSSDHPEGTLFKFDVEKSDSLVSPYLGTVQYFSYDVGSKRHSEYKVSFAYQRKKWVVKEVSVRVLGGAGWRWMSQDSSYSAENTFWRTAIDKFYRIQGR